MSSDKPRKRLDEILVQAGLVSQDQIREALARQKERGGKFGSQLLYNRYIDEAGLVKALAIQFECEGVVLSRVNISPEIAGMIPAEVAQSRKAMPFDFDAERNELKVACEDPSDQDLLKELHYVAQGKNISLYVAAELALNTAIAKYYLRQSVNLDDNLRPNAAGNVEDTGGLDIEVGGSSKTGRLRTGRGEEVMLVTDDDSSGPVLKTLLERDNFVVTVTDSADEAIQLIGDHQFHSVFIKDTVSGDYLDLIDRLRKLSPRTVVRYYESASSLLLNDDIAASEADLLHSSLDVLTSLLAHRALQPSNHAGRVGAYADRLCRRLGLPVKERQMIVTAGYVHDLAMYYYQQEEHDSDESMVDVKVQVDRTAKLLASLNFPPIIVGILKKMYIDLKGKYRRRLPIEALGGNIVTIVDIFCDSVPLDSRLSLDRFDAIKKKLRELTGKLFLVEVVEAFVSMIQEEILATAAEKRSGQVMLVSENVDLLHPMELRLRTEGFHTLSTTSPAQCAELCERSEPDILLVLSGGDEKQAINFIEKLEALRVNIATIPTFLLVRGNLMSQLTKLLDKGIEDIINLEASTDILFVKLDRILTRLREQAKKTGDTSSQAAGTTGRLADMSLIDILQAMGPSRKTAKITLTPAENPDLKLELYLSKGNIHFAQLGDLGSPEAVYKALAWADGHWRIEPINDEDMPEANNELPNDAILMEGCRLIDEESRTGRMEVS